MVAKIKLSQGEILAKIQLYLRSQGREEDFIANFSNGYCHGISLLWTYSLHISGEVEKAKQDNLNFLSEWEDKLIVELITKVDEITKQLDSIGPVTVKALKQQ